MQLEPPDLKELRAIVDWVNLAEDIRELSIKFGDVELSISRGGATSGAAAPQQSAPSPASPTVSADVAPAPPPVTRPVDTAPAASEALSGGGSGASALAPTENEVVVKAPMVGVFYAAAKPGDSPFVSVGDVVAPDTVVGIVEVMKLMNNLEAKVDGTVVRVLVENEQAVEYGQPLMVISRDG